MATPDEILHGIERALKQANGVTDELDYLTREWGGFVEGDTLPPQQPFCEIQVPGSGVRRRNEPVVEVPITDNNDGRIGTFYYVPYMIDVQIEVNVAFGSNDDARAIGETVTKAMFRYDSAIRGDVLPGEMAPLSTVTDIRVNGGDARVVEESSPEMLRWIRTIEAEYYYGIDSTEEYGPEPYVENVVWAHPGQMNSTGGGETVSYNPRPHYP